jgi:asparagine synthase (glutamine-hydrolysing)
MCGIAGILAYSEHAPPADPDQLAAMRERMASRGPDGAGLYIDPAGRMGLAHRRLAIIDLSAAASQPMASSDGRYQVVFNGEIYNYRALRDELLRGGYEFRTQSDTEVLLNLYARDGERMCESLRGMFAFALWDSKERSLFLARDPFGIKPLYVQDAGGVFRFASQVGALLAAGVPEPEPAGVVGFWVWGHVPEPWTLYRGIQSLEPGTWLRIGRDGHREKGDANTVRRITCEAGELRGTLRDALLDSVRHHLVADVPVGIFLSGGVDSAALAALAAEQGARLHAVTLAFDEYRDTPSDETALAAAVAKRFGLRHEVARVTRADFEEALDTFMAAMDQPSTDGLNAWLVARAAARAGLKVALSGLGGDELFGGYPSFRQLPRLRRLARPVAALPAVGHAIRRAGAPLLRGRVSEKYAGVLEYGATWEGAYLLRRASCMPWELDQEGLAPAFVAEGLERLGASREQDPALDQLGDAHAVVSYLETTRYMRERLLRDADWAGMAHSVEIRVPLVDVPLARHVHAARRQGTTYGKRDLAAATRPALPEEVVRRDKTGFTVPVREWLLAAGRSTPRQRGLRAWQVAVADAFARRTRPQW